MIGRSAKLNHGTVEETRVVIEDVKQAYGVTRALVKNGNGKTAWRNLDTLKMEECQP